MKIIVAIAFYFLYWGVFRYVGGHIEVFSESGEFLFSADTMQEAWEELSA